MDENWKKKYYWLLLANKLIIYIKLGNKMMIMIYKQLIISGWINQKKNVLVYCDFIIVWIIYMTWFFCRPAFFTCVPITPKHDSCKLTQTITIEISHKRL